MSLPPLALNTTPSPRSAMSPAALSIHWRSARDGCAGAPPPQPVRAMAATLADASSSVALTGFMATSNAHHPVELLGHAGELGRRRPAGLQPLEVLVGRPTGDRAALSDVDRDLVVEQLLEELARGRDAHALDPFGRVARHELGRVTGENDGTLLTDLDGAVRRDVEWNRRLRRVARARSREKENLHRLPPVDGPTLLPGVAAGRAGRQLAPPARDQ